MCAAIFGIMAESAPKGKNNFTKYVNFEHEDNDGTLQPNEQPKGPEYLTGELEVARAEDVFLNTALSTNKQDRDCGLYGQLIVTNFRLTFLTDDKNQVYQENFFLKANDVTLQNIDRIYQVVDRKKRLLDASSKISSKVEGIHVVCKNFRVLKFYFPKSERLDFKNQKNGSGKNIAGALMKFAFPNQHDLLFSYKFTDKYYSSLQKITFYRDKIDWTCELNRCGAQNWRVISIDQDDAFPSGSLPRHFVIPQCLSDGDYNELARSFRNERAAIWVYSLGNVSLVRMAELMPTITDTRQENKMLETVRRCDPSRKLHFVQLSKYLPSNQDVFISYTKLRDLMTPDSTRQFMQQDHRFYTLLDKTCWMLYVSLCLKYANESAEKMRMEHSVVLQENEGRDMCCLISSLIQIILDPYYRTTSGFESLIQKDWISLGHPFSDRLGHVINSNTSEQSPLFLLFLDCTWQLLQQFPEEFEFSETFLTTLWDSVFLPIFDTFLFNSERDRYMAMQKYNFVSRPVWDWGEQFGDKDLALFVNPLYKKPAEQPNNARYVNSLLLPPSAIPLPGLYKPNNSRFSIDPFKSPSPAYHLQKPKELRYLEPKTEIRNLDIWMQCYYRWLPVLEIKNGGNPQIDLFNRMTLSSISKLQQDLHLRTNDEPSAVASNDQLIQNMPLISSFFPFTRNTSGNNDLTDILTQSNELLMDSSTIDGLSVQQE